MTAATTLLPKALVAVGCTLIASAALAGPIDDAARYWQFDGDFTDSRNGVDGTQIGGVGFGTDRDGNAFGALELDGYNDAVRIEDATDLGAVGDFSLSIWFQLDSDQNRSYLFDTRAPGSSSYTGAFVFIDELAGSSSRVYGYPTGVGGSMSTVATVDDGEWHNVTVVRSITESTSRLFIDGALAQTTWTGIGTVDMNDGLVIGAYGLSTPGSNWWTDGQIDDVALWTRALGSAEVSELVAGPASATSVPGPWSLLLLVTGLVALHRRSA